MPPRDVPLGEGVLDPVVAAGGGGTAVTVGTGDAGTTVETGPPGDGVLGPDGFAFPPAVGVWFAPFAGRELTFGAPDLAELPPDFCAAANEVMLIAAIAAVTATSRNCFMVDSSVMVRVQERCRQRRPA